MTLLTSMTKIVYSLRHYQLQPYFFLFQRQWNHSPNLDISTLLWNFHDSIAFIESNGKKFIRKQDFRNHVQLCIFCHTTSVLPKWWCQFQKQSSTKRLVESFEERTFSEQYPNSTCVSIVVKTQLLKYGDR